MLRRSLIILATIGVAAGASGCSTFSERDDVARVDDVALTIDEFETRLIDLGASTETVIPADPVRAELTSWIREQLVDGEGAGAIYDAGAAESGSACLEAIVVEDEATAEEVVADLESGAPFVDTFAANNIDPGLADLQGRIDCIAGEQFAAASDTPFLQEAIGLSADEQFGLAPIIDETTGETVAFVVLRFRPFSELTDADIAIVVTGLPVQVDGVDIWVDPRYGTFDSETGTVVALR